MPSAWEEYAGAVYFIACLLGIPFTLIAIIYFYVRWKFRSSFEQRQTGFDVVDVDAGSQERSDNQ